MVENIKCIIWGREIPEIEIDELIRLQRLFVLPLLLTLQKNTAHKKTGAKQGVTYVHEPSIPFI